MIVMFLFFSDERAVAGLDRAGRNGLVERHTAFNHDVLEVEATVLATRGLQPTPAALTVRPAPDGGRVVTAGPHAPTAEALAGFYLVECRDMAHAEELARRYPMPPGLGCIELRPVMQEWDYAPFADLAAPPGAVWECLADVAGWARWRTGTAAARLDGPLRGGATGVLTPAADLPVTGPLPLRVVDAAPGRGVTCETDLAPGITVREEHALEPLPGGGTRITLRAVVPRAALDRYGLEFSPAYNARLRDAVQRLRALLDLAPATRETA